MEDQLNFYNLMDVVATPDSVIPTAKMPDGDINLMYTNWQLAYLLLDQIINWEGCVSSCGK